MKTQKIALFGDAQTIPYVRDTLALDSSLAPRIIDPTATRWGVSWEWFGFSSGSVRK